LKLVVVGTHADRVPDEDDQQVVWDSLKSGMDIIGHVVGHIAVSCEDGTGFEGLRRGIELAIDASKLRAVQVPKSYEMIETFIKETRK
jgi:predicted choloylglycine hydrolase